MPEERKFDPFKPSGPRLPGVEPRAASPDEPSDEPTIIGPGAPKAPEPARELPWKLIIGGGGTLLVVIVVTAFILMSPSGEVEHEVTSPAQAQSAASAAGSPPAAPAEGSPVAESSLPMAPAEDVGTVEEFAKPWAAKRFRFRRPLGDETPAIMVRLPSGSARSAAGYWAFSLRSPYGKCTLEYEPDLARLRSEYKYSAQHPMVVDPCDKVVFDPLRYGNVRGNLIRGHVVQGPGFRPPTLIEVRIEGSRVLAPQIEP